MESNTKSAWCWRIGLLIFVAFAPWLASALSRRPPVSFADNEAEAIVTLREIAAAEAQVKANAAIDTDGDGVGEYGYLAELAGTQQKRVSQQGVPAAGTQREDFIRRPLLRPELGRISFSTAVHDGYRFMTWLPQKAAGGQVGAQREDPNGGKMAAPFPDPRTGSELWCCYAWPVSAGVTGQRAFFVNQEGIVLATDNDGATPFSGVISYPDFGEALDHPRDMASGLRIGPPVGGANQTIWTKVW
jgi:hypothetical protein